MGKGKRVNLSSEIFENAVFTDAVLETELLPELHPDLVPTLSHLQSDYFSRHSSLFPFVFTKKLGLRSEQKWDNRRRVGTLFSFEKERGKSENFSHGNNSSGPLCGDVEMMNCAGRY